MKLNDGSLIKNPSTRLRFSVWVIIANFVLGIIGMLLGADLTSLGVFLGLSNAPLYAYVLGRSFRAASIPKEHYTQSHGGAGGLGEVLHGPNGSGEWGSTTFSSTWGSQQPDEFNNPNYPQTNTPLQEVSKPLDEIG